MQHFPIFLNLTGKPVIVSGAGDAAVAKLRLLLKTQAKLYVFGTNPHSQIETWAAQGCLSLTPRALVGSDLDQPALLYGANEDDAEDARVAALGRAHGALVNIVDNLHDSDYITPAIVDRDPVTIAIGTEGAAPVLARKIKADLEEQLPATLGLLTRIGQAFRPKAEALPMGRKRRDFWSRFYFKDGAQAFATGGQDAAEEALNTLLADTLTQKFRKGHVALVGAGPGDPDLLTLKARKLIDEADVVIHDQLVPAPILELARREAIVIETGKRGFGPSWKQEDINALLVEHAQQGHQIVRLKSGDPAIFGRLDEEIEALDAANIDWQIVPGITAASAAAASIGQSLTKRSRNSALRILTAHDIDGFAKQDWRDLATPNTVAAIYMGKRAASFLRGRLLMHGAADSTPITLVENVSRADQTMVGTTLLALPDTLTQHDMQGPVVMLLGLTPRHAQAAITTIEERAAL